MRKIIFIVLSGLSYLNAFSQIDSISVAKIPDEEYAIYKYDSDLEMTILTYHYADLWDIDNDKYTDVIEFISNGGAHSYYHMRIWLSSKSKWIDYPKLEIDFPYLPKEVKNLEMLDQPYPQFVVQDFDNDNIKEIYLNLDDYSSVLAEYGIPSKRILIDFKEGELIVMRFKTK